MEDLKLETRKSLHAVYALHYHLILVTKYRKPCITEKMFTLLKIQAMHIFGMNGGVVEEMNYEPDHVHLLLQLPPTVCLSTVISNYKATSSRLVRKNFPQHLANYYWKDVFWSRSYLILSSGGAPIEVIKKYIQEQGTPEHEAKTAARHKQQAEKK